MNRGDVERGQVLTAPGSITPHSRFDCELYVLTKDDGGRHTPFRNGYQPQFYFRTTDVTGGLTLPNGVELVMHGETTRASVELHKSIAMEVGQRFALREGTKTVGAGKVLAVHACVAGGSAALTRSFAHHGLTYYERPT